MISSSFTMTNFLPTYLYIKQHTVTGKLYFGKTTKKDPLKYNGSGRHWFPHIKKHGIEQVETLWYCLFTDQEELTKFALMCSEKWDIVKSDEWLNQTFENGLGGSTKGCNLGKVHTARSRANMSAGGKGKIFSEHLSNLSIAMRNPSVETRLKMSVASKIDLKKLK